MLVGLMFLFGIANFAVHKAVLESRHPLLDTLPDRLRANGGRVSLTLEFLVLLSALAAVTNGWSAIAWIYALYSLANGLVALLLLDRRI